MIVYVVTMQRWADEESHSYVLSVHSTLRAALELALEHMSFRDGKYEPFIESQYIDGCYRQGSTICRNGEDARKLLYDMGRCHYDTNM